MQNNVRADGSTYQGVRFTAMYCVSYFTNDGYSPNSTWSRGRLGVIRIHDELPLHKRSRFWPPRQPDRGLFHQPSPADYVPYWISRQTNYKEFSAAAIAASGLLD